MTENSVIDVPRLEQVPFLPWNAPEGAPSVQLREATAGGSPRLETRAILFHDDAFLHVLFDMRDEGAPIGSMLGRDDPIYREDVLEIFLAPWRLTEYFELEISPVGTIFDARVESPDGDRSTMRVDASWDCDGLVGMIRRQRGGNEPWSVQTLVSIPFAGLGAAPSAGDVWRANLFRIDRRPDGDEYSAWCPTLRRPADFHVPGAFGSLRFA